MLKHLIQFSIDRASVIMAIAGLVLIYAGFRFSQIPVDVFPELNAPTVVVMTESPGLAADEAEQYVTFPIETSVNGIPGVRRVRSSSAFGLSIVWVEFDWGKNIYTARQMVSERLDTVRDELPDGAHAEMTPITSITGEIMLMAVSSPDKSVSDLDVRAYAEFELRNKLLSVPGVAQVSVIGGELPEYQVLVKQDLLRLYELTLEDVAKAVGESNSTVSAGYLTDVESRELPIRQSGRVEEVKDIAGTVIKYHEGAPVTIEQIGQVQLGPALKRGTGADYGLPAVIMTVQKAPGTNTLQITREVDALLSEIQESVPKGIAINSEVFRQSRFINYSISNVVHALRDAAIIVSVILIMFLMNVRTTVITLVAMPLSLAVGILVLDWLGMTINVMTLGGFAIAVGSLVDDAIIDVENVHRRLNQNASRQDLQRENRLSVIFNASNEIRPAMVFATLIISIVFIPLMLLEGIEGRFFQPLGVAFVVSIGASLLVALTVTPAMCRLLLKERKGEDGEREGIVVRVLKRLYEPVLKLAVKFRVMMIAAGAVLTIVMMLLGSTFGAAFLPEFNEGTFTVFLFAPPGTSLQASDRLASSVEKQLIEIEGVESVARRTGRAERDEHAEPVSNSEIEVTVKPGYDKIKVRQGISRILEKIPGITTNIGQPIEHRLSHILSGTPAAIAVNVYGDDLSKLRVVAKRIEKALKSVPGAREVNANREVMIQSLPVNYRAEDLARYGLTPKSAAHQVRRAMYGERVDTVNDGMKRFDLVVRLVEGERDEIEDLRNVLLRGKNGAIVRLEDVADIGVEMTSNLITRENAQRKAVVSMNVKEGYNLGHLIESVREVVNPIVNEFGYTVSYGGQFEAQQSASRTILIFGGVVLLAMLLLLQLAIGSFKVSILVMLNLPLALIGGILAIYMTESPSLFGNTLALFGISGIYVAPVISIASMVGFITLFGIAVRNGILLVNHYQHLMKYDGAGLVEAVMQGSMERLVPILMTALTAALAVIPIVLKGNEPGNEILAPLSVVILGGLLSSTFLNLLIIPAGYVLIHRADRTPAVCSENS